MLTVGLALGASLCWGSADFLAGVATRRLPVLTVLLWSQVIGLTITAGAVAIRGQGPPAARSLLYAAIGGVIAVVGATALYRGLAVGAMGIVAPISATNSVIPIGVSFFIGERPGPVQAAGIALALTGVVLAAREPDPLGGRASAAAGVGPALVAAVGLGSSLAWLNAAADGDALWAVLSVRLVLTTLVATAVLVRRTPLRLAPADRAVVLDNGVLDGAATLVFSVASTRGLISVVAVLGQLYPVVVALLAFLVLHERISRPQLIGVAAALAGVGLIAAA
ncbi:MAG TPA: DMT family transporter [Actinomycetota bacterium]